MDITNFPSVGDDLAVRALLAAYCQKVDDKDTAGVVALFSPDAALAMGEIEHTGRDAISAFYTAVAANPPGKHLTTNIIVAAVGGNRFNVTSDFAFVRKTDDGGYAFARVGRYLDVVERKGSEYWFARREMVFL